MTLCMSECAFRHVMIILQIIDLWSCIFFKHNFFNQLDQSNQIQIIFFLLMVQAQLCKWLCNCVSRKRAMQLWCQFHNIRCIRAQLIFLKAMQWCEYIFVLFRPTAIVLMESLMILCALEYIHI